MNEIGEASFIIYDSWGRGIPLTESMTAVIESGLAMMSIMSIMSELLEEML